MSLTLTPTLTPTPNTAYTLDPQNGLDTVSLEVEDDRDPDCHPDTDLVQARVEWRELINTNLTGREAELPLFGAQVAITST